MKLENSVDTIGGFKKFEVVRNQNGNGPAVNKTQSNGVEFSSSSAPVNTWAASFSTFGRAAESYLSKPSPSACGAEGFEHLESDDLFAFDEDIGWAAKHKVQETDPGDDFGEDVEVEEKMNKDSLTASSPHAGSLPIEIKWSQRREKRG